TTYDLSKADRILSLGSDFLNGYPGNLRYARDYAAKRRNVAQAVSLRADAAEQMSRLYVIESTPTITGANADHRWSVKPSELSNTVNAVYRRMVADKIPPGETSLVFDHLADDLKHRAGASLVMVGDDQPPIIHAFAHFMNAELGNVGKTVFYSD